MYLTLLTNIYCLVYNKYRCPNLWECLHYLLISLRDQVSIYIQEEKGRWWYEKRLLYNYNISFSSSSYIVTYYFNKTLKEKTLSIIIQEQCLTKTICRHYPLIWVTLTVLLYKIYNLKSTSLLIFFFCMIYLNFLIYYKMLLMKYSY